MARGTVMASDRGAAAGGATSAPNVLAARSVPTTRFLDPDRFLADFHASTVFGATPGGGLDRQAGTADHGRVRDWFQELAENAGFT
ncbi:MAG: hypothetical protein ACK4M5_15785, partial [Dietzia cercidiphylli]